MSIVSEIVRTMAAEGYGHEDVLANLKARGLATNKDREFIRRYVLGLSQYTRRFGT